MEAPTAASASDQNWTRGILQVEEAPLARVVAELARYRRGYLGCADDVATVRVTGTFPLHDSDRALRLMRQAATQGHRLATFSLRGMYAEGRGAPRNPATAFAVISAVPSPDEEMMQCRDRLAADMAPSQRDHAMKLANALLTGGVSQETLRRADGL